MVVGHALSRPNGPQFALAGTEDFEVPHFVLVGDGEALARINPAVFLQQHARGFDGLASGAAPLQQQHAEPLAVNESAVGLELRTTAEGRFADGQLRLVHARVGGVEELVGVVHLRNLAHGDVVVAQHLSGQLFFRPLALVEGLHGPLFVILRGGHIDVCARTVAVVGVRGHHRTVGRRLLTHRDGGAFHTV